MFSAEAKFMVMFASVFFPLRSRFSFPHLARKTSFCFDVMDDDFKMIRQRRFKSVKLWLYGWEWKNRFSEKIHCYEKLLQQTRNHRKSFKENGLVF